jgi:hypothetical protein
VLCYGRRYAFVSTAEQTVSVTVTLPKDVYERVALAAADEQCQIEELLSALVAEGLDTHATVRDLLERASTHYRAHLSREGKLQQSSEEVLQELRDVREQLARELYP